MLVVCFGYNLQSLRFLVKNVNYQNIGPFEAFLRKFYDTIWKMDLVIIYRTSSRYLLVSRFLYVTDRFPLPVREIYFLKRKRKRK